MGFKLCKELNNKLGIYLVDIFTTELGELKLWRK